MKPSVRNNIQYGVVIPSKNRFPYVIKTLSRLQNSKNPPTVVAIIDSSANAIELGDQVKSLIPEPKFKISWLFSPKSGTAVQRNTGIEYLKTNFPDLEWVMLLDDDLIFEDGFFNNIDFRSLDKSALWFALPTDSRAEMKNRKEEGAAKKICKALGLYPNPGRIAASGFHASLNFDADIDFDIEWAPSALMVFHIGQDSIFPSRPFSENFGGYGYLEDLEMSLRMRNSGIGLRLLDIRIEHPTILRDSFIFGKIEVVNRAKILKAMKNGSVVMFLTMISLRILKSLWEGLHGRIGITRFFGSLYGFFLVIVDLGIGLINGEDRKNGDSGATYR